MKLAPSVVASTQRHRMRSNNIDPSVVFYSYTCFISIQALDIIEDSK